MIRLVFVSPFISMVVCCVFERIYLYCLLCIQMFVVGIKMFVVEAFIGHIAV